MGSSTLTIVLGSILIVAGVVGLILFTRSRRTKSSYKVPPVRSRTPEQELSDLGILEIRPKQAHANVAGTEVSAEDEGEIFEVEVDEGDESYEGTDTSHDASDNAGSEDSVELIPPEEPDNGSDDKAKEPPGPHIEPVNEEEGAVKESVTKESGFIEDATVLSEISEEATDAAQRTAVSRRETLFRMMNAIQASVDGNTACLVKKERAGSLFY